MQKYTVLTRVIKFLSRWDWKVPGFRDTSKVSCSSVGKSCCCLSGFFWLHVKIKMWFSIIPIYLYNVFSFACFGLCLGKFDMVSKYDQLAVVLFWLWGSASYSLKECVSFNLTCSHAIYFTLTLLEFWIEVKTKILRRHIQYISTADHETVVNDRFLIHSLVIGNL